MTFDPDRTNVLPSLEPAFPITEELPVVRVPGQGRPSRFFLGVLAALLVAGIAATAAILVINDQRSNQVADGEQALPTPVAETPSSEDPAPTPVELDADEPGYWQVVGVPDGLNVRSGPGTDNAIVGSLRLGDRHIFATGQRATSNGSEWKQITFGQSDATGWVSATFLSPDTPPDENAPTPTPVVTGSTSVVCFAGSDTPVVIARITFTNRTTISGILRTVGANAANDQSIAGVLENGRAELTLTTAGSNQATQQSWTFNPASVDLGDGRSLQVVGCDAIAAQLS